MVRKLWNNGRKRKPSFSRLIVDGFNTEHLHLPDDFLKHISKDQSRKATLRLKDSSSDSLWTVNVVETRQGAVYFKEGWMEFLKDNSLVNNEFLTFIYHGNMHFRVNIFLNYGALKWEFRNFLLHANCSRRPHPSNSSSGDDSVEEIEDSQEDSEDDTYEDLEDNVYISESSTCGEFEDLEDSSDSSKPITISSNTTSKDSDQDSEDNTLDDREESNVAEKPFKSKFPHFTCVVRSTYNKVIPRAFHCHFPTRQFDLTLKNAETGTKRRVRVVCGYGRYCISAGFSAFLKSSRIRPGDTCMFEILNKKKMLVRVLKKG